MGDIIDYEEQRGNVWFSLQDAEGGWWLPEGLVSHADAGTKNDADCDLAEWPDNGNGEAVLDVCSSPFPAPPALARPEVLVMSNITQLLGFPWSQRKTYSKLVNYTALVQGLPVCFTGNRTKAGCVCVDSQIWKKIISKTLVQSIKMDMSSSQTRQAVLPQTLRPCGTENGRLWNLCSTNLSNREVVTMIPLYPSMSLVIPTQSWAGLEIQYWTKGNDSGHLDI